MTSQLIRIVISICHEERKNGMEPETLSQQHVRIEVVFPEVFFSTRTASSNVRCELPGET